MQNLFFSPSLILHFYLLPDNTGFRSRPTESRVASLLRAEDWPSNCPRAIDVVQSWMPKKDHTGSPAILQHIVKQSWKGLCLKDFGPPKNKGEIISVMSNSNLSKGILTFFFSLLNCLWRCYCINAFFKRRGGLRLPRGVHNPTRGKPKNGRALSWAVLHIFLWGIWCKTLHRFSKVPLWLSPRPGNIWSTAESFKKQSEC